jgi:hypothetical protein
MHTVLLPLLPQSPQANLGEKGVEPQHQLLVAPEQLLDPRNDARGVDPASPQLAVSAVPIQREAGAAMASVLSQHVL